MALANRLACYVSVHENTSCPASCFIHLVGNLFLVLEWKVDKVVKLGTHKDGNGRFVETSALAIPLLDAVQRTLAGQVEHEENGHSIVTHKGQHVDEFTLTTQIPNGKGDFSIPDRNCLLHKVDTQCLDVIFVPASLNVFDHERRLADLRISNHSDFDHDMVTAVG